MAETAKNQDQRTGLISPGLQNKYRVSKNRQAKNLICQYRKENLIILFLCRASQNNFRRLKTLQKEMRKKLKLYPTKGQ